MDFGGRCMITDPISLLIISLLRFCLHESLGRFYISRNLFARLSNFLCVIFSSPMILCISVVSIITYSFMFDFSMSYIFLVKCFFSEKYCENTNSFFSPFHCLFSVFFSFFHSCSLYFHPSAKVGLDFLLVH